jgi:hypothetical protein
VTSVGELRTGFGEGESSGRNDDRLLEGNNCGEEVVLGEIISISSTAEA